MKDPFDNPLVNDIRKMLSEDQTAQSKTININGINAKSLDFSEDINDPSVHLFGLGVRRVSTLRKEIQQDLMKFAEMVGRRDAKDLLVYLTDFKGKYSSNMYFAYKLQALMEVEEFLKSPAVKRKITLLKKQKQGG